MALHHSGPPGNMDAGTFAGPGASRIMSKAIHRRGWPAGLWAALVLAAVASPAAEGPRPSDDLTFRPTVVIRKGDGQGSGTIIASRDGETLVLTASHVVEHPGRLRVELHRYNLGVERFNAGQRWPLAVAAEVAAADSSADVAILRVRTPSALPFVARLGGDDALPARGTAVTSVGIDLGTRLSSWTTRVTSVDRFEIEGRGDERLFLITTRCPEHGRSGGGLFLSSGELVGVCVGHAEFVKGRPAGVFASGSSIRRLLRDHDLDAHVASSSPRVVPPGLRTPPITTTRAGAAR